MRKGTFVNNMCGNANIPKPCADLPPALFYFMTTFQPDAPVECHPLIGLHESDQLRILDPEKPDKQFTIEDKERKNHFRLVVTCDERYNYPQYATSVDSLGVSEYSVASKFSCGEYNESARDLDNQKIWVCLLLILLGLFILTVAGVTVGKLMVVIAGVVLFVFLLVVIFTFFGFQLTGYASAVIFGACASVGIFVKFILKKVKQLFEAVTTLLTVKIGYIYGAILFPGSPLHERVVSPDFLRPVGGLGHRLPPLFPAFRLPRLHPARPPLLHRLHPRRPQPRLHARQTPQLPGHSG